MSASEAVDMIIEVPQRLSRLRRAGETALTALAGGAWLAIVRPVLTLVLWGLGLRVAVARSSSFAHQEPRGCLASLGLAAAAIAVLMLAWNRYHALRFRSHEPRLNPPLATCAELAAYFALTAEDVERLRESRQLEVERPKRTEVTLLCAEGTLFRARHDPLGPPPPLRPRAVGALNAGALPKPARETAPCPIPLVLQLRATESVVQGLRPEPLRSSDVDFSFEVTVDDLDDRKPREGKSANGSRRPGRDSDLAPSSGLAKRLSAAQGAAHSLQVHPSAKQQTG